MENDDRRDVASMYCLSATIAGVDGATDKLNQGKRIIDSKPLVTYESFASFMFPV